MRGVNLLWFGPLPTILLARSLGLPGTAGLSCERTRSSDQQFEALLSGEADVVVTAIDNVITWNERDDVARFRAIAQVESTTPLSLVGRPGVSGLEDLQGASLLVDSPTNGFVIALQAMLLEAGLGQSSYRLVSAGGVTERMEALLAGQGDATLLGPPLSEVAMAQGCLSLARVQDSWPAFPGQGLVVSRARLPVLRDSLIELLGSMETARRMMVADPARCRKLLEEEGLPPPALAAMLATVAKSHKADPAGIDLVIRHRAMLDLPGGALVYGDLVDDSLIEQAG